MPICENCLKDVYETLEIILPKNMKRRTFKRDFRGRIKAKICFECIKMYARTSLRFDGYWHKIVFPHQHGKARKK